MSIRIERITAEDIGPIKEFDRTFSALNLIYSKNEKGKTFLTEFIIRSLFKNIKRWQFRQSGAGKVMVSGLEDTVTTFYPSCPKKMEDFWEEGAKGIPTSLVKLLVSKGAQPSIDTSQQGVDKSLIKEIFSGVSLLDTIDSDSNISKTIKSANLDGDKIDIKAFGEGKTLKELASDLEKMERLFSELESKYNKGILASFQARQKMLEEDKSKLYQAKCYAAYLYAEEIKKLDAELSDHDEETLHEVSKGDLII
jgi:hypothetical protein